jgi:hypothetical protein
LKTTIFLPERIKVGFQNRSDTYTGQLAYVIYYDQKNKLRKEASWNSWRDEKIDQQEYKNEPTSGFVLNKKVGDYVCDWNHRQAYVRVYDPRNFEFEITIENLLYILENANSIKGKGLEGDFIYGWDGKDLILVPTLSPDYKEIAELNILRHENKKFEGKNLILGGTYKSNNNNALIYLGRFYENNEDKKETKTYFFYDKNANYNKIIPIKSLSGNIIDLIDKTCIEDYSNLMDELLKSSSYSSREPKYDEYLDYTLNDFKTALNKNCYWHNKCYVKINNNYVRYYIERYRDYSYYNKRESTYNVYVTIKGHRDERIIENSLPEQVYNKINPKYLVTYNDKKEIIKEWK